MEAKGLLTPALLAEMFELLRNSRQSEKFVDRKHLFAAECKESFGTGAVVQVFVGINGFVLASKTGGAA